MVIADTAQTALVISIISAAVTAGGLIWQLVLYRLSGSRLEVRLIPAVQDVAGTVAQAPDRGWGVRSIRFRRELSPWVIDLAHVRVTNIGRTPVSVLGIALDFGPLRWWRPRRRYTAAGFPVAALSHTKLDGPVRLDAGESVSVFFDVWPLISSARTQKGTAAVDVRATAEPAGRRRRRSPRRKRWRIAPGQHTLQSEQPLTPELAGYRAMWRHLRDDPELFRAWNVAQRELTRGNTDPALIADELEKVIGDGPATVAYEVVLAYRDTQEMLQEAGRAAPHDDGPPLGAADPGSLGPTTNVNEPGGAHDQASTGEPK